MKDMMEVANTKTARIPLATTKDIGPDTRVLISTNKKGVMAITLADLTQVLVSPVSDMTEAEVEGDAEEFK